MNRRTALGIMLGTMVGGAGWGQEGGGPTAPPTAEGGETVSPLGVRARMGGVRARERRVMALYYPWYQSMQYSHRWAHQDGVEPANHRMVSHAHYPSQGPYDSSDPAQIDRHLAMAEEAGIDTLVCSWWGQNDPTDHALRLLLMQAGKRRINICVFWEQLSQQAGRRSAEKDLTYLVETFGNQGAYLRVDGKPVVFAYERVCSGFPAEVWAQTLNDLDRRLAPGVLVLGDGQAPSDFCLWAGTYRLGTASVLARPTTLAAQLGAQLSPQLGARPGARPDTRPGIQPGTQSGALSGAQPRPSIPSLPPATCARAAHDYWSPGQILSHRMDRLSVAVILPGYDDRKANRTGLGGGALFLDRSEGTVYSSLWQQAIADAPDWVLINSFNQWHIGTEIEPSVEMGNQYMQLTSKYAQEFKQKGR